MATTFSNYSDEDLLITKASYKSHLARLKINRFCFSEMLAFKQQVENDNKAIDRLIVLLHAIEIEISKREIYVQG